MQINSQKGIKSVVLKGNILVVSLAFLGVFFLGTGSVWADEKDVLIQQLMNRVDQLEKKVDSLEQKPAVVVSDEAVSKKVAEIMAQKQPSAPPLITMPKINGFIDTTYNYNFAKPAGQVTVLGNPHTSTAGPNNVSSFVTKSNNITFNAAQLNINGSVKDANYVIKLVAGSDANVIHPSGGGGTSNFDVEEAYFTTPLLNTGFNLKLGKFVTTEGIEVIESINDPTISRGYLFGFAEPFTQVGFLLSHPLPGPLSGLTLQGGVANGWDTLVGNNPGETFLGGLAINYGDTATGTLSVYYGPQQAGNDSHNRTSVDLTIANKPLPKLLPQLTLNLQGNYGQEGGVSGHDDRWYGFGIQPVYQFTDKFSIGGRIEQMQNKFGSRFGTNVGGKLTNFTITPAYKLTDNLTARIEYRHDIADKGFFDGKDGIFDDKTMDQVMAEFIWAF